MALPAAPTGSQPSNSALQRLQRDVREYERSFPLKMQRGQGGREYGVTAQPREGNLLVWDTTMVAATGSLAGEPIEMTIEFRDDYPSQPPNVVLHTRIRDHPNVFGDWICLDMIKPPEYYARPYQGWSAAYTLSSILIQLYGFLLVDETVDQMGGGPSVSVQPRSRPSTTTLELDQLRITHNTHNRKRARGPSATSSAARSPADSAAASGAVTPARVVPAAVVAAPVTTTYLYVVDDHVLRNVLGFLEPADLARWVAGGAAAGLARVARAAADVKQRKELVCFYSRLDYTDAVLGFGVSREWYSNGRRNGSLKSLVVRLDYLSHEAFESASVRRSAWNAPIDGFLPLYLNPEHGQRMMPLLPACVSALLTPPPTTARQAPATAHHAPTTARQLLTVLSQAMNSLVVEMVKLDKGEVPLHMSDAALAGFCHLHHLLLAVALSPLGQELVSEARRDVCAFVSGADNGATRHKERCPDLGVLLIELLLVPKEEVPWSRFLPVLLRETLARQVYWILQAQANRNTSSRMRDAAGGYWRSMGASRPFEFGVVLNEDAGSDSWHAHERLRAHFEGAVTSLRLVMLTCWFGLHLARPRGAGGAGGKGGLWEELAAAKRAYDACSGAPPADAAAAFNAHARRVMGVGSWAQALSALHCAIRCAPNPAPNPTPALTNTTHAPTTTANTPTSQSNARDVWVSVLRQAVVDSWVAGYHSDPPPWGNTSRAAPRAAEAGSQRHTPQGPRMQQQRSVGNKAGGVSVCGGDPWRGLYAPHKARLWQAKEALGRPFVEWEGVDAPVKALSDV